MSTTANGERTRARLWVAVLVLATVGTVAAAGGPAGDAGVRDDRIVAMFTDASPLLEGNDVQVAGVAVGKIESMEVVGDESRVTMSLDRSVLPVYRDARLTIRSVSLLGERYLDLERGTTNAPALAPGEVIPSSQTEQPPDLDQILNALDDPTSGALGAMVTTLGEGMAGNGENADAAIRALAPALADTESLVAVLDGQTELLTRLIDNAEPVAGALAVDDGKTLDQLVASADQLLATTADRQVALESTLVEMPATLVAARAALEDLAGVTRSTTPVLREIRPTTDDLTEISDELLRFADSADPALASAEPVLRRAEELLAEARPVTADLRAAGPDLRGTAAGLRPVVNEFTETLPSFWNFIEGWALTTNGHDGLSHYFRALVTVNTDQITHALPPAAPLIDGNPDADGADPLPLPPGLAPGGEALGGILQPGTSEDGGVTGLEPEQEGDALSYLLGGN